MLYLTSKTKNPCICCQWWTYKQRLGSTHLQCFAFGQFKTSPSLSEPAESSYIEAVTPSSEAKEHPPRNGAGEVFV